MLPTVFVMFTGGFDVSLYSRLIRDNVIVQKHLPGNGLHFACLPHGLVGGIQHRRGINISLLKSDWYGVYQGYHRADGEENISIVQRSGELHC